MKVKQASIKCPHCGGHIVVRQTDPPEENVEKIWAAADEAFKAMDAAFHKIFHPSLWRK
jgi:hypothetical protein